MQASLCQISNVSYSYPSRVIANETFSVSTTVTGSCAAGDDYNYSVRADVIDKTSGRTISASRIHITGYNASNFLVTVSDSVTSPAQATAAWNIVIAVSVLYTTTTGSQDSMSMIIRDYSTFGYATIQVGSFQTVAEFGALDPVLVVAFVFALAMAALMSIRLRNDCHVTKQ